MQSLTSERLAAALLLALIAGCVDAVGFGELGHFVSFMSGNTTQLGLALAAHGWSVALGLSGLIALFVGGAALGTLLADAAGRRADALILLAEAVLLGGAAALIDGPRPLLGLALLPVAMGLSNLFVPADRGARIGLTYMTGTLVRIGTGLARLGRDRGEARAVALDVALWLALLSGVVSGAIGRLRYGGLVLAAPALLLLLLAAAELVGVRRRR